MIEIRATSRIHAPPSRVWEFVADHESFLAGGDELTCEIVTEGAPDRNGLGAMRVVKSSGIEFREEITSFEPDSRYEYRIRSLTGPMGFTVPMTHLRGWVELTTDGEATEVVWGSRFRIDLFVVARMLERQLGRELESAFDILLERARRVVERG